MSGWLHLTSARSALGAAPLGQPVPSVPLNPLNRRTVRKPPRRKKITTQVWEGCPGGTYVSVDPEPTAGRKPPALLAFFLGTGLTGTFSLELSRPLPLDRVGMGCSLFGASLVAARFGDIAWLSPVEASFPFDGEYVVGLEKPAADACMAGLDDCPAWALRVLACSTESLYLPSIGQPFESSGMSAVYIPVRIPP
jgi:hypothetical protein